ncbi:MAG: hypothetical protein R3E89_13620 [Thiolinea sp.]
MTGSGNLKLVDMASGATLPNGNIPGEYRVRDFQFPDVLTAGMAYQLNERTTFVADVSRINWSEVMDKFQLSFTADAAVRDWADRHWMSA